MSAKQTQRKLRVTLGDQGCKYYTRVRLYLWNNTYGLLISNFTRFCIFQIKVYTFSTHSLWTAYGVLMDF
jgi:hypothetical protein